MPTPVIAYIEVSEQATKIHRAISKFCEERDLEIQALASTPQAAAQAVAAGTAGLVVAAVDPRNGLRHLVTVAHGQVVFVRHPRERLTVAGLFRRLFEHGKTPHEIAEMHDIDTTDVHQILRRGQPRPPE